ncbi:hypothetical protein GCM10009868_38690 [Terrabacter aerolatus]|uniref:Uncharacterized protein n=1 Tax=Terrabacter aerolatus TaxID=422442 RepID=A0A512D0K6_9MICO|nr:hypothetical protein TAE01_18080 [Terrabacter aerolatus]
MGHFPVYQVLLRGPTKIEYLFLSESQHPVPSPAPSAETLASINTHSGTGSGGSPPKAAIARFDLVSEHLTQLHAHLLRPMGVETPPADIAAAVEAFVSRRDALEQTFGVSVDRALEEEVRRSIDRVLAPGSRTDASPARGRLTAGPHGQTAGGPPTGSSAVRGPFRAGGW